jgi:hypothetical protein
MKNECQICKEKKGEFFDYYGSILCQACYGAFQILDNEAVEALQRAYIEERERNQRHYPKIIKPKKCNRR